MKCYRVTFVDGSALLVDAASTAQAHILGFESAKAQHGETEILDVECLDKDEKEVD